MSTADLTLTRCLIPPSWLHEGVLCASAFIAPVFLKQEKKKVPVQMHPLDTLLHLFQRAAQGKADIKGLLKALHAIPLSVKQQLALELLCARCSGNDIEDPNVILSIIDRVAKRNLGMKQALTKEVLIYSNLEKTAVEPSCIYDLGRPELERGQIGFHNGMGCSLEYAKWNAMQLSQRVAQGNNLHCTYSASLDFKADIASAALGQSGILTPPVEKLLEQWTDFFRNDGSHRLLQICHSRGAIEVNNALDQLPEELRNRIIVITLAPACIVPADKAFRVVNLLIPDDLVVQVASNRYLMKSPHTKSLPPHRDTDNPHDPHGSSFREPLEQMVSCYIRTNDIIEEINEFSLLSSRYPLHIQMME